MKIESYNSVIWKAIYDSLFPKQSIFGDVSDLVDVLLPKSTSPNDPISILYTKNALLKYQSPVAKTQTQEDYRAYLQYPNNQIRDLAYKIVNPLDSDDTKVQKIQEWVSKNITYVSDEENYGMPERWAYPTETLKKMSGDCEDGAFLIHSLCLNSGVSPDRLRTYAGYVEAGVAAPYGGHAWTAYKRETDNEWVAVDWCYYPDLRPMDKKQLLIEDKHYVDDWWYMNNMGTYDENNHWGIDVYV